MRMTRLRAAQTIAGAVASPWLMAKAAEAQVSTIRVAMIAIEPTCLIYYAKENGYFEKAGINVEITENPSSPAVAAAVVSGTYDIGYATMSTLAEAHVKGLPFVMIAAAGLIVPDLVIGGIMTPANSTIRTAKDCNGKTFGTSGLNTQSEYAPRAWVDKHGGDSSTIKFIEIPFPQTVDALAAGRIDAAYLVEPFITIGTRRNLIRMLASGDDAIAPTYLASAWYASSVWTKAHPELVSRFAAAIGQAARWANANPTKVVPIIVDHLRTDPALTAATPRTVYTDRLVDAQIQPWIDITARYAKFAPFPAADLIYRSGR
jgi:NitT/TauT family transport system substrate-binding protein